MSNNLLNVGDKAPEFTLPSSNGDNVSPPEECMLGDINGDGALDITDVVRQINIVLNIGDSPTDEELCSADINADGVINVLDIISVVNLILDA